MIRILQQLITAGMLLISFTFLSGFTSFTEPENGNITGRIVDDSTTAPVSFASVALLNAADSSLLTGLITDELGKFSFEKIPYGKYNLKVTFVGYKPIIIRNIEVTAQQNSVDLHEMKLVEDFQSLDEAVIVGQRLKGEEKVDRTVYALNDDVRKASNTALDALKHIPSVTVDYQNNVTLEGQ